MKIDLVSSLVYALMRNEKERVHTSFTACIANEKEGAVKNRLRHMFDEYKRREGMAVIEKLDFEIQGLVSAPYKDCGFEDLMLSEDIQESTDRLLLEWANKDYLIENGLMPSNRILLEGPPGNGKTSYAIAIAKKLGLPLLNTSSSLMLDSHMGASEKNVSTLFKWIPEECVLFIDEFEAMASHRGDPGGDSGGAGRAWNSIVTAFLVHMESLRPSVLFLAATNRADMLDKAIVRRFDMKLGFENPTEEEKASYIDNYLNKYELDKTSFIKDKVAKKLGIAVSYSALESVMRKRHKEMVLDKLISEKQKGQAAEI